MHYFNLYDTAQMQYYVYLCGLHSIVSGQCQVHVFFGLYYSHVCPHAYVHMWPAFGKLTKLSHLLFQGIAIY